LDLLEHMDNSSVLSAEDIHRDFDTPEKRISVLKGITIDIKKGDLVSITGPSGVGKSTLLHILGGLDKPTQGEVNIKGQSLKNENEKSLANLRNKQIGFVFQFHYLLNDFNALENVMIPMMVAGMRKSQASDKGELLLEQVGLKGRKSHLPTQLSGGEQQRVAVARALANNPEIVLADEPSGNLDTETGRFLHELLFRLNSENNVTMLIATHNRELAENCHRQLKMMDGRIYE